MAFVAAISNGLERLCQLAGGQTMALLRIEPIDQTDFAGGLTRGASTRSGSFVDGARLGLVRGIHHAPGFT